MIVFFAGIPCESKWMSKPVAASVAASLISKYRLFGIRTPDAHHKLDSLAISLAAKGIMPALDIQHVKKYEFAQEILRARTTIIGPQRGGSGAA